MFHLKKLHNKKSMMGLCLLISLLPNISPAQNNREYTSLKNSFHFDTDSYQIRQNDTNKLDKWVTHLEDHPDKNIYLYGHADQRGTDEYNLALSGQRANAIADYLNSFNINRKRIFVAAYGELRPVCTENNEACYQKNRFVSISL